MMFSKYIIRLGKFLIIAISIGMLLGTQVVFASESMNEAIAFEHYVTHKSSSPAIAGQFVQIHVREKVLSSIAKNFSGNEAAPVVLCLHGATSPGTVVWDFPYQDYSFMAYLAQAGFDTFCMDFEGYAKSTRPWPMNDPHNLPDADQALLKLDKGEPSYSYNVITAQSEWDAINSVVDYIRELRGIDRVNIIGWSMGGQRGGGFTALHPEKVDKLVLYAPAYSANKTTGEYQDGEPAPGNPFRLQTWERLNAGWDAYLKTDNMIEPGIQELSWQLMLKECEVDATWGPGTNRIPNCTNSVWGQFNPEMPAKIHHPTLFIIGEHDYIRESHSMPLYKALVGVEDLTLVDVKAASHFLIFEKQYYVLLEAAKEWFLKGEIKGIKRGEFTVDTEGHWTQTK